MNPTNFKKSKKSIKRNHTKLDVKCYAKAFAQNLKNNNHIRFWYNSELVFFMPPVKFSMCLAVKNHL